MAFNPVSDLLSCKVVRYCMLCNTSLSGSKDCFCYHEWEWAVGKWHFCCAKTVQYHQSWGTQTCYEGHLESAVDGCTCSRVRHLQKKSFFSVRWYLVTVKAVFLKLHISTFSRWNFSFSALAHLKLSEENLPSGLPLHSLLTVIDLQTFSGFWLFVPLRRGRVWMLGLAVGRKAAELGSHMAWCGCKDSCTSARKSFAVWYSGCLLVPEWGSSLEQQLMAEKFHAKALSQSSFACTAKPFYLCFPQRLRICPLHCDELRASRGCLVLE